MSEYIEREAALESVREKLMICDSLPDTIAKDASLFTLASMQDSLKSIPAADVRPVVRATWQSWEQDKPPCKWYSCDYCGFHALSKSNFCPNCGADMRGRKADV